MLLQAALNGARTPLEHPAIPVTPAQLASEARGAVEAGVQALHVHVRDSTGGESLAPDVVASTLQAIRAACPRVPVGISTGAWIVPDVAVRLNLCRTWNVLPDFASVNVHEPGALQLMLQLRDGGIDVEAGIWDAKAARTLLQSGVISSCLRLLLEPADAAGSAQANLREIEAALCDAGVPKLLHGMEATTWEFIAVAAERGYDTRIGFEDTLSLPDGTLAKDNAVLVTSAIQVIADVNRLHGEARE